MSNPRNRNLLIIIAVLFLTNIGVLFYFLGPKKQGVEATQQPKNEKYGVAEMLQKEVGFDEDQTTKYKEMKEKQREKIHPLYDDMRKAKDSLFRLLSFPETNDSVLNNMTDAIARKQKAIDLETFNHFRRVRVLCKTDQLTKYDSMVVQMFRKMGKPARHKEVEKKK